MRIAFDHQIFAAQTYGGISRYIARLAQQYVAGGEEVKIVAPLHVNKYISGFQVGVVYGTYLRKLIPHTYRFVSALNHVASIPVLRSWKPSVLHETYIRVVIFHQEGVRRNQQAWPCGGGLPYSG